MYTFFIYLSLRETVQIPRNEYKRTKFDVLENIKLYELKAHFAIIRFLHIDQIYALHGNIKHLKELKFSKNRYIDSF